MKKAAALLLILAMLSSITACKDESGWPGSEQAVELIIFAAASMTDTLTQIAGLYRDIAPNVTLTFTFDSSGTLKTQIEEGADCDVFISAAQKQMNELDIASDRNTDGLDFVDTATRFQLVENRVVLVVPEGNPAGVTSFEDVTADTVTKLAVGNADVPVGQYAREIFENLGIWDQIQGKITYGSNVRELTTWVKENIVDCCVVYGTDAYSESLQVVAEAPAGGLKTPVLYPAAVIKSSKNPDAAKAFLEFLKTDACSAVFKKTGFYIPAP
jgi:molybdate transport system substrate-binding protein